MKKYEFEYFVKEVKKPKRLLSFLISKKNMPYNSHGMFTIC